MSHTERPHRVLVAHGSAIFRHGLTGVLAGHALLEVVGEAAGARELMAAARRVHPNVIVCDTRILGGGEEVSGELLRQVPGVTILTLSSTGSLMEAARALYGHISGYVMEEADPDLLAAAIIVTAHGYAISPRGIMHEIGFAGNQGTGQWVDGLSPREFEVLCYLADGMTTRMLADRCGISEKTVRNHIAGMYAKLGLHGRSQLVRYAIDNGLVGSLKPQAG